jgi:hypothetical protein
VSIRFFNSVEVPVLETAPTPEAGFASIYGKGTDAYVLFSDGTEKQLSGGVVVVSGTRDVTFPEELVMRSGLNLKIPSRIDSHTYGDSRKKADADITNTADTVVSSTNFTDTANMADTSTVTASLLSAQQTLLSGTLSTVGNITVSLPDFALTPLPTILTSELQWGWTTAASASLQHINFSLSVVISYSINEGVTYVPLETVTATNSSADNVLTLTATYDELQKIRFKAAGTVNSGTATSLDALQNFQFRYARCNSTLEQTL